MNIFIALGLFSVLLSACSSQPEKDVVSIQGDLTGKNIENLRPVGFRLAKMPPPKVDTKAAIKRYQSFLEIAPRNETSVHVMHRLADLKLMDVEELLEGDAKDLDPVHVKKVYQEAVESYERVLQQFPGRRDSDRLLYQLAKVYMLKGDTKNSEATLKAMIKRFPTSELLTEAYYRLGDLQFNSENYYQAEKSFSFVAKQSDNLKFYTSSNYMRGWSQFKQRHYRKALASFVTVIDSRFKDTTAIVNASRTDKELLDDTVRVMSMVFAYEHGYKSISAMFQQLGPRHYEYLIYDELAEYYLGKGQFSDAAKTYQAFVSVNPQDVLAPIFYGNLVSSYKKAGYVDDVIKHKIAFIERYGIKSDFWNLYDEDIREVIRPKIKGFTSELAQYHHARAQKTKSVKIKFNYLFSAVRWYQEYIDTFPDDDKVGGMYFLKGEALYEVGKFDQALLAYINAGFDTAPHKNSEEAAWASLVTYNRLIVKAKPARKQHWLDRKVNTAMRFADVYPASPRTSQVLVRAAEALFSLGRFDKAVEASSLVIARGGLNVQQKSVALLIKGHSHFDLKQFSAAELAYVAAINVKQLNKNESQNVREKLAASIYKQGVASVELDLLEEAVDHFMRVGKIVPESLIRITAHYDAAAYLMKKKSWSKAEVILISFRKDFPAHKLAKDIPSKLIIAYENMEQWKKAAFELQNIWRFSKNKNRQRIALYQAAEYYEKAGDVDNAMSMLKRYAHNYPKPFDAQLEAISKLEDLYLLKSDHTKRRYWLEKLIASDQDAGNSRTDRSKYLAAKASFQLADYERIEYARIELTLPLKTSLGIKKVALKRTMDAYQRTAKMEVQEFTTASTYQIAEIYGELSRDLMNSQRPSGLDELELEEYEYLLEDQAFPFEEVAINIHETNIKRSWDGLYDDWISQSIGALSKLMPARYGKKEVSYHAIAEIH
jgi:tetratricopeptide (TPR) repeat protein